MLPLRAWNHPACCALPAAASSAAERGLAAPGSLHLQTGKSCRLYKGALIIGLAAREGVEAAAKGLRSLARAAHSQMQLSTENHAIIQEPHCCGSCTLATPFKGFQPAPSMTHAKPLRLATCCCGSCAPQAWRSARRLPQGSCTRSSHASHASDCAERRAPWWRAPGPRVPAAWWPAERHVRSGVSG